MPYAGVHRQMTGGNMEGIATLDELLASRLDSELYTIEATGHVVRIRGLSRYETLLAQKHIANGQEHFESHILAYALVEPRLTVEQALAWLKASPAGELEPLTIRIQQLSAVGGRPDVEAYERFRGESGAGVRGASRPDAGPDGSGAAADDQ